jgi:hypothetical protein
MLTEITTGLRLNESLPDLNVSDSVDTPIQTQ